eukprot:717550-Rhodomonas_salina.6
MPVLCDARYGPSVWRDLPTRALGDVRNSAGDPRTNLSQLHNTRSAHLLSPYELATRCPVLTSHLVVSFCGIAQVGSPVQTLILLCACSAMFGTN